MARSDSRKVEIMKETFDFCPIAKEAVESVRALAESKQISLHFVAPETLIVNGDSQRLSQLLYILLDNAIKYTPIGGEAFLALSIKGKE
ncbi:hypothetical protein ACNQFZ_10325 [Schinkia sp. CFF1]